MAIYTRKKYFSQKRRWQSWLDVEAALARVLGREGIIPQWAACKIAETSKLEQLDKKALRKEVKRTMAPVHALACELAKASGEAGGWVHWGATTQNIIDAGRLLVLRDVQKDLKHQLALVLNCFAYLADKHAETSMVGRTNRQQALPITFGFKIASWIDEFLRIWDQLEECEERLFELRFGGAIGAFHSLGEAGPDISIRLAEELGLRPARYEGRVQVDVLMEYVSRLGIIGVAAYRVASDLYQMMQSEVGELAEDFGAAVVGSSTMPHKSNPKLVVRLIANANRLRSLGAGAYSLTPPSFEGDSVTNREMQKQLQDTVECAFCVILGLQKVIDSLSVNSNSMTKRLVSSGKETSMENVMMHLAKLIGRGAAHDVLHEAIVKSRTNGKPVDEILLSQPEFRNNIEKETLNHLLDPEKNIGQSVRIARQLAAKARERTSQFK